MCHIEASLKITPQNTNYAETIREKLIFLYVLNKDASDKSGYAIFG